MSNQADRWAVVPGEVEGYVVVWRSEGREVAVAVPASKIAGVGRMVDGETNLWEQAKWLMHRGYRPSGQSLAGIGSFAVRAPTPLSLSYGCGTA